MYFRALPRPTGTLLLPIWLRTVAMLRNVLVCATLTSAMATGEWAAAQTPAAIAMGPADIAGMVRGPNGPEAGVWVIAETKDLGTRFAKIVVTDDLGRLAH